MTNAFDLPLLDWPMRLTDIEVRVMTQGNPGGDLNERTSDLSEYSDKEKDLMRTLYEKQQWGYHQCALELGWNPKAARKYLGSLGILRKRQTIPSADYALMRKLLAYKLTGPQIVERTGWTMTKVRTMRTTLKNMGQL